MKRMSMYEYKKGLVKKKSLRENIDSEEILEQ